MKAVYPIFRQIVKLIPHNIVANLAKKHDVRYRHLSPYAHICALLLYQLGHSESLNSVCDLTYAFENMWHALTNSVCPCRNTFSYANMTRNPQMAEELFWAIYRHLQNLSPDFFKKRAAGFLRRFKKSIYAIDSTTIKLTLNCIDWAKHRRRKAAAKMHLTFDLGSLLPQFAIVEKASRHDSKNAYELTQNLKIGDICVADRAYSDYFFMEHLNSREIFFVFREKKSFQFNVIKKLPRPNKEEETEEDFTVISDEEVRPGIALTATKYTGRLRRVTVRVKMDSKLCEITFLTNNFEWTARSVSELYKGRWNIEVFFKEFKQTCQLNDFIGYSENAIKWQVWTALLAHLLLRYIAHMSQWKLSFSRLAAIIRGTLWKFLKLRALLELYGTAKTRKKKEKPPPIPYIQDELVFTTNYMGQQN